jgi:hypothetical protein
MKLLILRDLQSPGRHRHSNIEGRSLPPVVVSAAQSIWLPSTRYHDAHQRDSPCSALSILGAHLEETKEKNPIAY